jgi:arginase family enzyme
VRTLAVPYHLDEHLPDLDLSLAAAGVVAADLAAGDPWTRMAVLYGRLTDAVAGVVASGAVPLVQSGDCTMALGTVAGLQRAGCDAGVVWFDAGGCYRAGAGGAGLMSPPAPRWAAATRLGTHIRQASSTSSSISA